MIRSLLYVPAHAPRFVARAHERGADAIILDLEDAVPPADKPAARAALAEAVPAVGRGGAAVFVRINAETADADAAAACQAGAAGLFVPKVRSPDMLLALASGLERAEQGRPPMRFVPLLEDPGAVLDARSILSAGPRIMGVAVGGEDLATAMDAEPGPNMLLLPKMMVHLAAKAAGVLSFGMLRSIADYTDVDGIAASAAEARALGFDGASCIHPAVVPILNAGFAPTPAALDRARRMIAAFEAAGGSAFTFEGKMVDLPIVERAPPPLGFRMMLPRSLLFVPATSARKVEKALASAADAVIVDLEDAVATAEKPQARQEAAGLLAARRGKTVFVRVNALGTSFCYPDLLMAAAAAIDGIVLPKAEAASDILTVDWLLTQLEAQAGRAPGSLELMPIIETAKGVAAAASIAAAAPRLKRLAFGAVDLALDMDIELADDAGAINHARFALTLASRAAGLEGPVDTVFTDIADTAGLDASTRRARAMGFGAKACIHPAQIETINAVFTPSAAELDRARAIVTAFDEAEAKGLAAVSVGGVMVDYPVVLKARRTLGYGSQ